MGIKIHKMIDRGPRGGVVYVFHCPGCGHAHPIEVPHWTWNGSFDKPTFRPSLLCNGSYPEHRCHSFLTEGTIQFLGDCHHGLKSQTVEIPDWDDDAP